VKNHDASGLQITDDHFFALFSAEADVKIPAEDVPHDYLKVIT
jgi:hypothetical protein